MRKRNKPPQCVKMRDACVQCTCGYAPFATFANSEYSKSFMHIRGDYVPQNIAKNTERRNYVERLKLNFKNVTSKI